MESVWLDYVGWVGFARGFLHLDDCFAPLVGCDKCACDDRYGQCVRHDHARVDRHDCFGDDVADTNVGVGTDPNVHGVGNPICEAVVAETESLMLPEEPPHSALSRVCTRIWQLGMGATTQAGMFRRPKPGSKQA